MKKLIVLLPILALLFIGCGHTPKRIAYTSLSIVATSVDAARATYVDVYKQGKVSAANHAKVVELDKKYTLGMLNAINLAQYNWSSAASTEVIIMAEELINTIVEVTK